MDCPSILSFRNQNMGFDYQAVRRRRRRHDILFDGCSVLAHLFFSICSSIHEVNLSLDCMSSGPILSATNTVEIHEGPNPSTPASHVPPTEKQVKRDDPLPNFKVADSASSRALDLSLDSLANDSSPTTSATELTHEGFNQSADNEATGDGRLLDFKVTDSSSCKPLSSSLGSKSDDLSGTNTVDTRELLGHHSPASLMPPICKEANSDVQLLSLKTLQLDGKVGDTLSDHDLNSTTSSSCQGLLALNFLSRDLIETPSVDSREPWNLSEMDPADNEANINE